MTEETKLVIPALSCGPANKLPLLLKLVGYYTKGARPNWGRLKEYHAWKDHVREQASKQDLVLPDPTEARPVRVDVTCYFQRRVHADPENVRKGIVDALFPGGEKHVYGYHHHPVYDAEHPRAEVVIFATSSPASTPEKGRKA